MEKNLSSLESAQNSPSLSAGEPKALLVEPESLEGVASAYRYKLTFKNPCFMGSTLYFDDSLDVFSFHAVEKKRALKKEDWPTNGSMTAPNRFDVKVQLMAGNVEIQNCDGCASWKDKTRKPFLVLTPTGDRCMQYSKNPFILIIFRCCPKFHSCSKQFRLLITISSTTGEVWRNEVNIYRKKMINSKKRKVAHVEKKEKEAPQLAPLNLPPTGAVTTRDGPVPYPVKLDYDEKPITFHPRALLPQPMQPVVSPLMMYEMLYTYSDKEKETDASRVVFNPQMVPFASMSVLPQQQSEFIHHQRIQVPIYNKFVVPYSNGIKNEPETKKAATFWNFDAYPGPVTSVPFSQTGQLPPLEAPDERWLESIFSESNISVCTAEPVTLEVNPFENLYSQEINLERQF